MIKTYLMRRYLLRGFTVYLVRTIMIMIQVCLIHLPTIPVLPCTTVNNSHKAVKSIFHASTVHSHTGNGCQTNKLLLKTPTNNPNELAHSKARGTPQKMTHFISHSLNAAKLTLDFHLHSSPLLCLTWIYIYMQGNKS